MAELLLKIGDGANYKDGDCVCAFNDRRIQNVHAERICNPWKAAVTSDGLLKGGDHVQQYFERTHQYKFVRDGSQVTRVSLADGTEEDVSDQMDVDLYIQRRMTHKAPNGAPKKPIFGTPGNEVWYGGRKDHTKNSEVWDAIEQHTDNARTNYTRWPLTDTELRHFLVLPVDDFDDVTANDLLAPKLGDPDPVTGEREVLAKRKHHVVWRDLFPLDIPPTTPASEVTDTSKTVDPRGRSTGPFNRTAIVLTK